MRETILEGIAALLLWFVVLLLYVVVGCDAPEDAAFNDDQPYGLKSYVVEARDGRMVQCITAFREAIDCDWD